MFIVLVRYEGRSGKYPVVYSQTAGKYFVSANRYHDHDNIGSVMKAEAVQKVVGEVLSQGEAVKSVEILSV